MTCQAAKHASPGTRKSGLMLKKGEKHAPSEIRKLTGVPKSTQNMWIQAAKASGDWDQLKPTPRKRRSYAGMGRKLTGRMVAAIKRRLINNPRLTINELREKVPGLSEVSREWISRVQLLNQ